MDDNVNPEDLISPVLKLENIRHAEAWLERINFHLEALSLSDEGRF
jgi:hypothetical protein